MRTTAEVVNPDDDEKRPSPTAKRSKTPPHPPAAPGRLTEEYQKACSEVMVLRAGLVEILHSVREQDGTSDVKIESPILERLVEVLNGERLFGQYGQLVHEINSVRGENKILQERILQMASPRHQAPVEVRSSDDKAVQVLSTLSVDSGTDPIQQSVEQGKIQRPFEADHLARQVEGYEEKLRDVERELGRVKRELEQLSDKHDASTADWNRQESDWIRQIGRKVRPSVLLSFSSAG